MKNPFAQPNPQTVSTHGRDLLAEHSQEIYVRCDRMFGILLVLQWIAGMLTSLAVSPHLWAGQFAEIQRHMSEAVLLGWAIISIPLYLIMMHPGKVYTRHVIAVAQMLSSGLLIHLSGGRIETHFHIFGSLAFLAFYRDWRLLVTGTVVVALDQLIRGTIWPQSVFGVAMASEYRWMEHAAWVLFEDLFLITSCIQSRREMVDIAVRQADSEETKTATEFEIARRTSQLRESETRFRTLVEGTDVIVWEYDPKRHAFTYVSPQAKDFGYSLSDWMVPGFWQEHVPAEEQHLSLLLAISGMPTQTENRSQHRFLRADGSAVWVDEVVSAETSDSNEVVLRGVLIDITERKRLETQLAQAHHLESIGQLAAGIAHEINTPTQYVSDNVHFLRAQFDGILGVIEKYGQILSEDQQRDRVDQTLKEADFEFLKQEIPLAISQSLEGLERVNSIVRAMKEFSHPGSATKEPADLNHSIISTIEVCRNRWKYIANMQTDLAADMPLVPCRIGEFNQVMLNLIVNAADAIAERVGNDGKTKGLIQISTRLMGEWVEIRVTDNGAGIPEKAKSRIFEPFFTTKPVGKGTGQGLSLSRNVIVNRHGGEMFFESTEDWGTTFCIRLPLSDKVALPHQEAA